VRFVRVGFVVVADATDAPAPVHHVVIVAQVIERRARFKTVSALGVSHLPNAMWTDQTGSSRRAGSAWGDCLLSFRVRPVNNGQAISIGRQPAPIGCFRLGLSAVGLFMPTTSGRARSTPTAAPNKWHKAFAIFEFLPDGHFTYNVITTEDVADWSVSICADLV
jgi:hypothetical protein